MDFYGLYWLQSGVLISERGFYIGVTLPRIRTMSSRRLAILGGQINQSCGSSSITVSVLMYVTGSKYVRNMTTPKRDQV